MDVLLNSNLQSPLLNLLDERAGIESSWTHRIRKGSKTHSIKSVFLKADSTTDGATWSFNLPRYGIATAIYLVMTVEADSVYSSEAVVLHEGNFYGLFKDIILSSHAREIERVTAEVMYIESLGSIHKKTGSGNGAVTVDGSNESLHKDAGTGNKYVRAYLKIPFSFFGHYGAQLSNSQNLSFLEQLTVEVRLASKSPGNNPLFNSAKCTDASPTAVQATGMNLVISKKTDGHYGREVGPSGLLICYSQFQPSVEAHFNKLNYASKSGSGPRSMLQMSTYAETPVSATVADEKNNTKMHYIDVGVSCKSVIVETMLMLRNENRQPIRNQQFDQFGDLRRIEKVQLWCNGSIYREWESHKELLIDNLNVENNSLVSEPQFHADNNAVRIKYHSKINPLAENSGCVSFRNTSGTFFRVYYINTDGPDTGVEPNVVEHDWKNKLKLHVHHLHYTITSIDPNSGSITQSMSI